MGRRSLALLVSGALQVLAMTGLSAEEVHIRPVRHYVESEARTWFSKPQIVDALLAQNKITATLSETEIAALDKRWRLELEEDSHPMIDKVMDNELSDYLRALQEESRGRITEIIVMDARGLNVGQSDVTSDYWQGDEAKFQKTFGAGPGALFIDDPEYDESTQMLQAQVSATLLDTNGRAIGAITIGLNLDQL